MSRASALYRLQQTDLAIDQARAKLAGIEAGLADHAGLEQARREAEKAQAQQRDASRNLRAAEDAVTAAREKLGQVDGRLYGGAIHNPKELQELQSEGEALRRHLGMLEDRLLEAMQTAEDADSEADKTRLQLELTEADASGRAGTLAAQGEGVRLLLRKYADEQEAAAAGVREEDLLLYRSLRKGPGSLAVAELEGDTCSACGVTMSASAHQEIRSGPGLTRCRQCGRILYAS